MSYGVIGVINNLAWFSVYLLVTYLGVDPKLAMAVLYFLGATMSYVGNRRWSFRHEGQVSTSFAKYVVAHIGGIAINYAMLVVFVDRMGYPHQLVQGLAIFVVAAYLFVAMKLLVFKPQAI